jgi:hypothetical protein
MSRSSTGRLIQNCFASTPAAACERCWHWPSAVLLYRFRDASVAFTCFATRTAPGCITTGASTPSGWCELIGGSIPTPPTVTAIHGSVRRLDGQTCCPWKRRLPNAAVPNWTVSAHRMVKNIASTPPLAALTPDLGRRTGVLACSAESVEKTWKVRAARSKLLIPLVLRVPSHGRGHRFNPYSAHHFHYACNSPSRSIRARSPSINRSPMSRR